MSNESICDECGLVEERDELLPCELNGDPAHICLRCTARFARWWTPTEREEKAA